MQEPWPLQRQASGNGFIRQRPDISSEPRMHLAHSGKMAQYFGCAVQLQIVGRPVTFMTAHHRRECCQIDPAVHQLRRANNTVKTGVAT